ncbi:hypothetical protein HAX54_030333, partial [Datura stramonium]|nr:hypothetical protein [Datura stramonium]
KILHSWEEEEAYRTKAFSFRPLFPEVRSLLSLPPPSLHLIQGGRSTRHPVDLNLATGTTLLPLPGIVVKGFSEKSGRRHSKGRPLSHRHSGGKIDDYTALYQVMSDSKAKPPSIGEGMKARRRPTLQ